MQAESQNRGPVMQLYRQHGRISASLSQQERAGTARMHVCHRVAVAATGPSKPLSSGESPGRAGSGMIGWSGPKPAGLQCGDVAPGWWQRC